MMKLGLIGWRGMVGSVLLQRMQAERDFDKFITTLFSTSAAGQQAPSLAGAAVHPVLHDAYSLSDLQQLDVIISCQGSDYSKKVHPELRNSGWRGYWIDAASALRTAHSSTLILDPVNHDQIKAALHQGCRDFIGPNCVISLALMGLAALLPELEWINLTTYQAVSGAGAQQLNELLQQMQFVSQNFSTSPDASALALADQFQQSLQHPNFPQQHLGKALVGNLLPWIDADDGSGVSREEWKSEFEANKILGYPDGKLKIDGTCVRVPVLRCHSSAITFKMQHPAHPSEINNRIAASHQWIKLIANNKEDSLQNLTPAAVSGTLTIAAGRLRPLKFGDGMIWNIWLVGDQLLWGAAEPLRRMLHLLPAN